MSTLIRAKDSLPMVSLSCLFAFLLLDESFRSSRPSIIFASLVAIVCGLKAPKMAGFFFCLIFLCLCHDGNIRNIVSVLGAVAIVGLISYRGHLPTAIAIGLFLIYVGSTEIFEGAVVPKQLDGAAILALLFLAAIIIGYIGEKKKRQLQDDREKAREALQLHREAAIRTLHDSVASTLTSSILRAESLALEPDLDPDLQDSILLISQENRKAMAEVRTLIQVMNEDEEAIAEHQLQQALETQISDFKKLLESHEFEVRTTTKNLTLKKLCSIPEPSIAIMSELAANIIKYGVPRSTVSLELDFTSSGVRITTRNEIAVAQSPYELSTGIGLKQIEERTKEHGGRFSYGIKDDQWVTVWESTSDKGTKVPSLNKLSIPLKQAPKKGGK